MKSWCVLVVLCLTCFCHGAYSCPATCKCYTRRAEVVCNEVSLTEYPTEGLLKNTTLLTIQFTNITSISEQQLSATPLLQGLHLYSNHLTNLSSHLLRGVPHLQTMDLTGNQLSDLPADVFSHAPLHSLVLKNNLIKKADAEWLHENSNLTWLDLSGNQLMKIPTALLQKLPNLDNLDLANNQLEKIPANSLDSLSKLERLNMQNNKLNTLDASVFQTTRNLTSLFLTRNKLSKLPQNLFQELTQLRHLSLDDNQLSHIPAGLLDPLTSLDEEGLDLTGNPFLCDGKVEYLWRWLQKNKTKAFLPETITCGGPESLVGRPVMSLTASELKIQSYQHSAKLRPNSETEGILLLPFSVLKMIWWLLLAATALAESNFQARFSHSCPDQCSCLSTAPGAKVLCSRRSLAYFPELGLPPDTTHLSFHNTQLRDITAGHLSAVPLLTFLQLYYNNLTTLPAELPAVVPRLNELDLTGNQLVHLPPRVFSFASLRRLMLRNNLLEEAHADWFPDNSSLTWLDLSCNRLTSIPAALLHKLPHLETLDLNDNNLQQLQEDALKNLHHLESLNLGGNKLITLEPATFAHNLKLSQLSLHENQLRELPANLLKGLQHLQLLLLFKNQLQYLPSGLLNETRPSFRMVVSGNPWECDGRIEYLWRWLGDHLSNVFFLNEVTCNGPEALKNEQIVSLTESQLVLKKTQSNSQI
ncbi:leucine-rich repeat protein SHOC-2 [Stegastes partitus]|uniref:Leucine-rich repeat protein SHOC-2 n=1 Tax=Stegastes partitus TaxID=144197 RepID=A0A9Y4MYR8_9TELE|nr:PREDICTED: leucine-rich repeat protein SHOC-2-like [Stegastes partitus]